MKKKQFFVKKEIDTQIFVYKKTRQPVLFKVCLTACRPKNLSRSAKICRLVAGLHWHIGLKGLIINTI